MGIANEASDADHGRVHRLWTSMAKEIAARIERDRDGYRTVQLASDPPLDSALERVSAPLKKLANDMFVATASSSDDTPERSF
jgi:hypothetical protein